MELELWRGPERSGTIVGQINLTWERICYTIERGGGPRLPAGRYPISERWHGPAMAERYAMRYGPTHEGMLYIGGETLIHAGHESDSFEGGVLVAASIDNTNATAQQSHPAYKLLHHLLAFPARNGECWLTIRQL